MTQCELFAQLRLDSTLQVVQSQYCNTESAYQRCARYEAGQRGQKPAVGLMPSGKILPVFDGPSGLRALPSLLSVRVVASDHGYVIATVGQILITYWIEQVSFAGLRAAGAAADELLESTDRYGVLNLTEDFIPLPSIRMQQEAAALMKKTGHAVTCSATVLHGDGMWVRGARSMIGIIGKLALTSYPLNAFATIASALVWMRGYLPGANYEPSSFKAAVDLALKRGAFRSSATRGT